MVRLNRIALPVLLAVISTAAVVSGCTIPNDNYRASHTRTVSASTARDDTEFEDMAYDAVVPDDRFLQVDEGNIFQSSTGCTASRGTDGDVDVDRVLMSGFGEHDQARYITLFLNWDEVPDRFEVTFSTTSGQRVVEFESGKVVRDKEVFLQTSQRGTRFEYLHEDKENRPFVGLNEQGTKLTIGLGPQLSHAVEDNSGWNVRLMRDDLSGTRCAL